MSHFTVIVIGENVDEQLAPYAEQEADPQYLKFNDVEDETLKEFNEKKTKIVLLSDGTKHSEYAEEFRVLKGFESEYVYPSDAVIYEGHFNELYSDFEEYMSEWHSHKSRDEDTGRYGYWHNPNAKWDWFQIGGRWSGYFKPKAGTTGDLGSPGVFDNKPTEGWVDVIKLKDIDIEGMQEAAVSEANETYDKLESILNGRTLPSWSATVQKHGEDYAAAREEYNNLQVVKDLNKNQFFCMGDLAEIFGPDRASYVHRQKVSVMVPFAVVMNGNWYQKGEVGWFGMSNDEMTQEEWNVQFWNMLSKLDPETTLTLMDCHI